MLICIHEDRPTAMVGVKLLLLSLAEHCPRVRVIVSSPGAPEDFKRWLAKHSHAALLDDPSLADLGWNSKPTLLLRLLEEGHREVVWIDSDIILSSDFRPCLDGVGADTLVVTEENYWTWHPGGSSRTRLWGLEVGRPLHTTINSGFVRVTDRHLPLLQSWQRLLDFDGYHRAQRRDMYERPIHMVGDQDVLTALVGSRRFEDLSVHFLKTGQDVITNTTPAGYTLVERLRNAGRKLPPLVHCVDPKPWAFEGRYERLGVELCPYSWVAKRYLEELDDENQAAVFRRRTHLGRLFSAVTGDDPALRGLPQAAVHAAGKRVKRWLGRVPWPSADSFADPGLVPDGESLLAMIPSQLQRRAPAELAPRAPRALAATRRPGRAGGTSRRPRQSRRKPPNDLGGTPAKAHSVVS